MYLLRHFFTKIDLKELRKKIIYIGFDIDLRDIDIHGLSLFQFSIDIDPSIFQLSGVK
tara:strand:- start:104342 stop:104515 length:174 start_codon:yes stop_codon:yes gene_type:complete